MDRLVRAIRGAGLSSWPSIVVGTGLYVGLTAPRLDRALADMLPHHRIWSDAVWYLRTATRFLETNSYQDKFDALWPPGQSTLLAFAMIVDPGLESAGRVQLVLAALMPLLIATTVAVAVGRRAFFTALALASLSSLYVHFGSLFLSDLPCACFFALGALGAALTCRAKGASKLMGSAVTGLWFGLANNVRGMVLPAGAIALCLVMLGLWRRRSLRATVPFLAIGVASFLLTVLPAARRGSQLLEVGNNAGAANAAMNVALGHSSESGRLAFSADARGPFSQWVPPALLQRQWTAETIVPCSVFNAPCLWDWVIARARSHPARFLLECAGNALDLISQNIWLNAPGQSSRALATRVEEQLFSLLVVLPGVWLALQTIRRFLVEQGRPSASWGFAALVPGLALCAAATMGEPRYRMPFDLCFVALLAERLTAGRGEVDPSEPLDVPGTPSHGMDGGQLVAWRAGIVFVWVVLTAMGLGVAVASAGLMQPGESVVREGLLRLRPRASQVDLVDWVERPDLIQPELADGTPAPEAGSWVESCRARCKGLRVPLPDGARRLRIGVDGTDAYRIIARAGGEIRTTQLVPITTPDRTGLHGVDIDLPYASSERAPFSIEVIPLYGDGTYWVGYVALLLD